MCREIHTVRVAAKCREVSKSCQLCVERYSKGCQLCIERYSKGCQLCVDRYS